MRRSSPAFPVLLLCISAVLATSPADAADARRPSTRVDRSKSAGSEIVLAAPDVRQPRRILLQELTVPAIRPPWSTTYACVTPDPISLGLEVPEKHEVAATSPEAVDAPSVPVPLPLIASGAPITFGVDVGTIGSARLYDVQGRCLAILEPRRTEAGTRLCTWSGLSTGGVPLASGIYFVRGWTTDRAWSRRVILIR